MGCAAGKDAGKPANAEQKPVEEKRKEKETPAKAKGVETPKEEKPAPVVAEEKEKKQAEESAPIVENKNEEEQKEEGKPVLRGHPMSQASRAVQWYVARLKKDVEVVTVDIASGEQKTPGFLAKHPFGEVPVYEEGDFHLSECSAILQYLSKDDAEMKPADEKEQIKFDEYIGKHHTITRKLTTECLMNIFMSTPGADYDEKVKAGFAAVKPILEQYNTTLSSQSYILGDKLTLADFLFAPEVDQLEWVEGLLDGYDNLKKYVAKLKEEDETFTASHDAAKAVFDQVRKFKEAEAAGEKKPDQPTAEQSPPKPTEEGEKKEEEKEESKKEEAEEEPKKEEEDAKKTEEAEEENEPAQEEAVVKKEEEPEKVVVKIDKKTAGGRAVAWFVKHSEKEVTVEEGEDEAVGALRSLSKGDEKFNPGEDADEYFKHHAEEVTKCTTECAVKILAAKTKAEAKEASEKGHETVKATLERYNELLSKQDFILGDKLTLADFLFAPEVDQLLPLGLLESHPKIVAYLERLREAHPEYKEGYGATEKTAEEMKAGQTE